MATVSGGGLGVIRVGVSRREGRNVRHKESVGVGMIGNVGMGSCSCQEESRLARKVVEGRWRSWDG